MEILSIHHFHLHSFVTSLSDRMEFQWVYILLFKNVSIFPWSIWFGWCLRVVHHDSFSPPSQKEMQLPKVLHFFTLEKLTTLWRNLFHNSHSLENVTISLYATTWKWTPTFFASLQTKSLPSKGFSLSMLYKLNPWLFLVLIQCPFSCLVWAHNLSKTTWRQARNETPKVHEMEQFY